MNRDSLVVRRLTAITGLGLVATPLIGVASPALAAGCQTTDPAASEVIPGVCEVQFVEAGTFTFSAPSGVAKLSAIVVGAGGGYVSGGPDAYAGGGGEVLFIETVDFSAPVDIEVGLGSDGSTASGGSSSVNDKVAAGGFSGTHDGGANCFCGGYSGNGNAGWPDPVAASGGGAGGAAPDQFSGGPGLTASAAADDSSMWPAVSGEDIYGAGGNMVTPGALAKTPGSGADTGAPVGEDGLVILRWTSALPATGVNAGTFAAFAAAFMIPGAALLAFAARSRRSRVTR